MKPLKIAIFSDTFPPQVNGVANAAYLSAKTLVERGHQVHVFTVLRWEDADRENNEEAFPITAIPSIELPAYPGERFALPSVVWFIALKKFNPDVIHSHTPFGVGVAAALGAKLLTIPLVGTNHTFYDYYLKHIGLNYSWMKIISWKGTVGYYNRCDLVLSPSQSLGDIMIAKGLKRPVEVIENFIDTDFFCPVASRAEKEKKKNLFGFKGLSIAYMGRLSYEKDINQVVRAFAVMLREKLDVTLMLIGDGPEKENLLILAEDLGVEKNIVFTGVLTGEALLGALQANEIFVTASRSENMPLSVLEAMATGLPVVTVKEKGLGEIIHENENGLFAKTGDHNDMALKMIEILLDPKLQKKLAAGSRTLSLHYSKDAIMARFEKVYRSVIESK